MSSQQEQNIEAQGNGAYCGGGAGQQRQAAGAAAPVSVHYGEPRQIDAQDLYTFVDRFISGAKNSSYVEYRWLAAYAGDLKTMAFHVKTGNHDTIRKQVSDFRLRELETEREKLQAKVIELNTEEAKLLRESEQLPSEMEE